MRLIDGLLDVARMERGTLEVELSDCDLGDLASRLAEDYRASLEMNGTSLEVVPSAQPLPVRGDPVRLAQALANFLQNAGKYAAGGHVRVESFADPATREAVVRVSDDGPGISPELLTKVFEPFVQAPQDLARSKGGLGLGLPVTCAIAQLHGGRATAASEGPGRGSAFELRLPLKSEQP